MRLIAPITLLALVCLASGCLRFEPKTDTTRFFVLSAEQPRSATDPSNILAGPIISRVVVPDYLNKRSLALRKGSNEIVFADSIQWAEPLDRGLARVLTENLRSHGREAAPATEIEVIVRQFDVSLDGQAILEADWARAAGGDTRSGRFSVQGPAPGKDPAGTITTMNQVLEQLAQAIAEGEGLKKP